MHVYKTIIWAGIKRMVCPVCKTSQEFRFRHNEGDDSVWSCKECGTLTKLINVTSRSISDN